MIVLDDTLVLRDLESRQDDLLLPWLDLYETAFPPRERMLVSSFLAVLRERERGQATPTRLLAALCGDEFAGLAVVAWPAERLAWLWYLAVVPEKRNSGLGRRLYEAVLWQVVGDVRALLLEVERPDEPTTPDPELARRRIGFYRRQGARLLGGISYLQSVGSHQPLTPMHVLLHPLEPLSPEDAFACAQIAFGQAIQQVGPLTLE